MDINNATHSALKDNFEFGQVLGEGAFGQVRLCKHKTTDVQYAAKIIKKDRLIKKSQTKYVMSERDILLSLSHPNVVKLFFTFSDEKRLYFITELISGGELFAKIRDRRKVSKQIIQFYMAELLEAILYIHSKNIVHRDLKPENLLLSGDGHLKLVDFGIAKTIAVDGVHTFCGTVEYLAPEIISHNNYGKGVDWWAYGCIIYELFCGAPPFVGPSASITCQKIAERDIYWPKELPDDAKDLIDKLLTVSIERRLGCGSHNSPNSPENIRSHKFFKHIKFAELTKRPPPIVPDEAICNNVGIGLNVSMYDTSGIGCNLVEEELLFRCRVIPFSNSQASMSNPLRRSTLLRSIYPELSSLSLRPNSTTFSISDQSLSQYSVKEGYRFNYQQTVSNIGTPVKCLAWSNSGKQLAASGRFVMSNYSIEEQSSELCTPLVQESTVSSSLFLSFSPDGQYLAFDCKRQIGILRQHTKKSSRFHLVGHKMPITKVSWCPDSAHLAAGGFEGSIYLWNVSRQKCSMKWHGHQSKVNDISWQNTATSTNLPLLASGGADGKLIIYDPNSNHIIRKVEHHLGYDVIGLMWSPSRENIIVSYARDRTLVFTDSTTWKPLKIVNHTTPVQKAIWSPNGKYLATVNDNVIQIWDINIMKAIAVLNREGTNITNRTTSLSYNSKSELPPSALVAFDHTSTRLAYVTSDQDNSPVVFDIRNNILGQQTSHSHRMPISCMEWSNNQPVLATGSWDNTIALWSLSNTTGDKC